jgi:anti-sigma factor RsiW
MPWNCAQFEERLSDSLEGALSPEDAREFSAHVASCAKCRELVESVGGLVHSMASLEMLPEPPGLTRKILDATIGPRLKLSFWQRWTGWTNVLWRPRLAMGALTLGAMAIIVFQASGIRFAHLRHVDVNPATAFNSANRQVHMVYARSVRFVNDLRVVYEIESRLQPQPEVAPENQPPSMPPQEQETPEPNPQQKSQTEKSRDRSQIRTVALTAMLSPGRILAGGWMRSSR